MRNIKIQTVLMLGIGVLILASCSKQETVITTKKNIEEAVFASGFVEHTHNYTVSAKADGILISLPIKEGDSVRKMQTVAIIENDLQSNQLEESRIIHQDALADASPNSPLLQNLKTQIEQAKEQVAFDEANMHRYAALLDKKSIAKLDYEKVELQYQTSKSNLLALQESYADQLENLKMNVDRTKVQLHTQQLLLADYKLETNLGGTVISVSKEEGELVRKGEAIALIASGDYIIKLYVAEDDITKVDIGQQIAIHVNTYPDQIFWANVTKIHPSFNTLEQSYVVEAAFDRLPEKMYSGTQLQANIKTGTRKDVVVIPTTYLNDHNAVRLENGEEVMIETGHRNGEWIEVISGLEENMIIQKPKS